MGKRIIKMWKWNHSELEFYSFFAGVGAIMGMVIMALIAFWDDAKTILNLGTVMAFAIGVFGNSLLGSFGYGADFNMAVSFGVTRKEYFISNTIGSYVNTVVFVVFLVVLNGLEWCMAKVIYGGREFVNIFAESGSYGWIVAVLVLIPVLRIFLGSLIMKFQKKAYWVIWILWMLLCFGAPRLVHWIQEEPSSVIGKFCMAIIKGIMQADVLVWTAMLAVVMVVVHGLSYIMQRKQSVIV